MFREPWFWISLSAYFFNSNFFYYKSKGAINGTQTENMSALAAISMLGVLVFWGIGLFVAAHWWQPILAWVISMTLPSIIGAILDSIMPRVARAIGAISPIISLILSIIAYIVWY